MIETILQSHFSRYQAMQIRDVYKLLYQAVLGSGHAVTDVESARNWLKQELSEMGDGLPEPLFDPISPGGEVARVHLRPFAAAGYDPDVLLDAFVRTANEYSGNTRQLDKFWQVAKGTANFSSEEMDGFFRSLKARGYPAVHHSPEYEKLYRPAYRVVASAFCPPEWLD